MYKALLFMSMGAVLYRVGSTKATDLGGLHRTMPWTTLFCLVGAASISALPLFSGFVAKSMVMTASHADPALFVVWLMLLFASAGVLEHSGIKIPYFAFFGHDSGKRPQEAPFNMLLAMGIAAALCILIGVMPGWLYQLLPFERAASEFLSSDLWTAPHVLQQVQLLVFATLAFMLLQWRQLYPAEQPGVIIDVEWLWRRGWPDLVSATGPAFPARDAGGWGQRGCGGKLGLQARASGVRARGLGFGQGSIERHRSRLAGNTGASAGDFAVRIGFASIRVAGYPRILVRFTVLPNCQNIAAV
jgi:multicomponent Na+:H+ antiporter subunit D